MAKAKQSVSSLALDLAATGKYRDWRAVELEIRVSGRRGARISDPFDKEQVDRICSQRWKGDDA